MKSKKYKSIVAWIALLSLLALQSGCSGCRQTEKPQSPVETEQPAADPPKADTPAVAPEPVSTPVEAPPAIEPEPTVKAEEPAPSPPALLDIPAVEASFESEPAVDASPQTAPEPVVPAEPEKEDRPQVDTASPVNTTSPVRTDSPVRQDSPVKQDGPVKTSFLRPLRTALLIGLTLSQTSVPASEAVKPPRPLPGETPPAEEAKAAEDPEKAAPKDEKSDADAKPAETEKAPEKAPEKAAEVAPTTPAAPASSAPETKPAEPAETGTPASPKKEVPPASETPAGEPAKDGRPQPPGEPGRYDRGGPERGDRGPERGGYGRDERRDGPPQGRGDVDPRGARSGDAPERTETARIEPTRPEAATPEEKRLRFSFRFVPWKDVIEWFAEQAGLSLQVDNVPQGSLNLTDSRYYTATEALDVLNSYLLFKEYTIIRKGKSMFVVYLPDGIPPNLLEPISPAELDNRGKYEICRCVFSLIRTTPDVIQAEIEPLLGPQGRIDKLPKSQQVLVTETGGTLRAIRDIVKRIDNPDELTGTIHIIELKSISADEALVIMRQLLAIDENDSSLRTVVDVSGTKIWVSGRPDMVEKAKETIRTIDQSYGGDDPELVGELTFKNYDPMIADSTTLLLVLQSLLKGAPDVRLSLDPKTGGIAAWGRPANHALIRKTVDEMQLSAPVFEVIPLVYTSPTSAVEIIKKFFETSTPSDTASGNSSSNATKTVGSPPPVVEADITNRRIIVKGTAAQVSEIRALLQKLGEDGTGSRMGRLDSSRVIPLSSSAQRLVLEQLQSVGPRLGMNEIKVVVPSNTVPMRSTSDLIRSSQNDAFPPLPPAEEPESLDDLIHRTLESLPETEYRGPLTRSEPARAVRYLPVQQSTTTFREGATVYQPESLPKPTNHEPVYSPIRNSDSETASDETGQLRRQIAELQRQLDRMQVREVQASREQPLPPLRSTEIPMGREQRLSGDSETKKTDSPILVSGGPGGIILSSDDPEALDQLEDLIRLLSDETLLGKTTMVVHYLKNSTAEVVASTLQTLLGTSSGATVGVTGSGSIDTSPAMEGAQRAELLAQLSVGGTIEKTGPVTITADSRLNALFIQANLVDHKTIELLLPILDQAGAPGGEPAVIPRARLIPLEHIRAEEAMELVKQAFPNRLDSGSGGNAAAAGNNRQQQGNRQGGRQQMMPMMPGMPPGGPGEMIQQMMSRMGNQSATNREKEATMSLAVDSRSNSLIVTSPESLFLVVQEFVEDIDARAADRQVVTRHVNLNINPTLASSVLGNTLGSSVKVSTSSSGTSQSGGNRGNFGGFGGTQQRGGFGGFGGGGGGTNPLMNLMRGAPGGGGFGGFGGNQQRGGFGGAQQRGGFGGR